MNFKQFFINKISFRQKPEISKLVYVINYAIMILIIGFLCYFMFSNTMYQFDFSGVLGYKQKFIDGFFTTLWISFFSLILSLMIGLFFAYGQNSKVILLRFFARFYIEIIRGTPLLVQILIFFYIFANNLGLDNRYVAGIIILSIFSGAYVSEILRAAFQSVSIEQYEAARSLGLNETKAYLYIIIPQAYKRMIPALTGQFASIIKDSSLLSIISIREFTMNATEVNAYTFSTLESYIPLAIGYFLITYPISFFAKKLENKIIN